ncbi:hypothetical protein HHI36_017071 [Cryptolaemus montrouzieri]|uniref:Uncharacterized protein n=1 Tax=Cryptolaemus montrouzieri TaxID=559131 RepID=A0ABD2NLR5_9CUCU
MCNVFRESLSEEGTGLVREELPEFPPTISVEGEPLDCGDTLRANCTSQPARPPARLTLVLNDLVETKVEAVHYRIHILASKCSNVLEI